MRNAWLQTVLISAIFLAAMLCVTIEAYAVGGRAGDQIESVESVEAARATQKSEAKTEEAEHVEHAGMDDDDQQASNDKTGDYDFQPVTQEHLFHVPYRLDDVDLFFFGQNR